MAQVIEFVNNYTDRSTDQGFQFEFTCDRCGTGYRTRFQPWTTGTVANVLDGASSLLGGIFGQAANIGERVKSAGWQKARDDAFSAAILEIRPSFIQCPKCQSWVCRSKCWNNQKGLCKGCAPDVGVEMSAAQASKGVETIWNNSQADAETQKMAAGDWSQTIRASCPQCGVPLATTAKFCPECGAKLQIETKCVKCGAKLQPGTKFCSECGTKI